MADTLKFGPEWLRALSDGNSVGTPPPSPASLPKYKLAEHRYGREEMLALFLPSTKMPECLREFPFIGLENAQIPLAVQPVTEEEQRIMSQSVNSAAAYRMTGRGIPPLRGRGGPERGRGRGRGRGDGFVQRGLSYDDTDGFGRPRPARGEPWEEGGLKRFERRFEDSSAMSPRKEFTRSLSSDNWREKSEREMDDDGDWRRAGPREKWGSRGNWREAGRPVPEFDRSKPNGSPSERGGFDRPQRVYRRSRSGESWGEEDVLPEWSVADSEDLDNVGTFDSSGAFVSKDAHKRQKDAQCPDDKGGNSPGRDGDTEKGEKTDNTAEPLSPDEAQQNNVESVCDGRHDNSQENPKEKTVSVPPGNLPQRKYQENSSQASLVPPVSKGVESPKMTSKNLTKSSSSQSASAPNSHRQKCVAQDDSAVCVASGSKPRDQCDLNSNRNAEASSENKRNATSEEDTLQRLEKAAVSMVTNVTDEEHEDRRKKRPTSSPKADAAGASVDPVDPDLAHKWFYRDPQLKLQGPFASNEMAEWFSAGYFTMSLLVRRGCDERFQPLGELIKRWNRVPFLPGPAPPPLLNSPVTVPPSDTQQQQQQQQQEQLKMLQQQMLVQQQLIQQQFLARQLQMQTLMQQLQHQDGFSKLSQTQQQQLALQLMLKQQHLLPEQQKLSPRSPPNEPAAAQPAFQRSFSQPANHSQGEETSVWGNPAAPGNWSQPSSVWDLEQPNQLDKARSEADELERLRRLAEAEEKRKKEEELERRQEMERRQEELRAQREELRRQQEEIQRQKEEIERQRLLDMQRAEEARRKEEEERKKKQEEVEQRKRQEEMRRQQERQEQELRQQALRQQQEAQRERERQQEMERLKEAEWQRELQQQKEAELLNQRQQEMQRRQELQQQQEQQRQQKEALRRLQQQQQEQLANMQLPATANWVKQDSSGQAVSLAEIQQLEEERQRKEDEIKRQTEAQRRQMAALQDQNQQQAKSWTKQLNFSSPQRASPKSLLEIQEEQARQLEIERQKKQSQQAVKPNLPLGTATVWGNGSTPSSTWASDGAWGNAQRTTNSGFWGDPTPHPHTQPTKNNKKPAKTVDNNFPALGGKPAKSSSNKNTAKQTNKPAKTSRDEEAVQRLFRTLTPEDEFTQWCENMLKGMATSVDVPTFVAFLQEVESPYEIHDYVRSYLGETKASADFAKQFVEKRSHYKNKARQQQKEDEDSIWGPAPAVNPKEARPISSCGDSESARNKKSKGKKKMQKLDASNLGFTVHAAPDRINVGQIESAE